MLKQLYLFLLKIPVLRPVLRHYRARLQLVAGYSDQYFDLADIALRSGSCCFLDIGCHHGDTLLRFIEAGLKADCFAVDPLQSHLSSARDALKAYANITYIQAAFSDRDGESDFFINRNTQTSSLLENDAGNTRSYPSDTAREFCARVESVRLDTWIKESGVGNANIIIKCDTQGAEGRIISGGLGVIKANVIAFYAEVLLGDMYNGQASFEDLRSMLEKECGMVLKNIYPCLHDATGRAVQMDVLWVKPEFL